MAHNIQELSLNQFCSNVTELREELQNSDMKLLAIQEQKSKLKDTLRLCSTAVEQLRARATLLEGEVFEWKQRECEVNEDIARLSELIHEARAKKEERAAVIDNEDLAVDALVNSFEQECHNIVSRMKALQATSENDELTHQKDITRLEEEIRSLESSEKRLRESNKHKLPFRELKGLL